MVLGESGFDVVEAENGKEAIEKLDGRQIDIILCDVNMPVMDGMSFLEELTGNESLEQYHDIPRIMLTTEAGAEIKERGTQLGVSAWLVKPFQPDQLVDVINENLNIGSKIILSEEPEISEKKKEKIKRKGKSTEYEKIRLVLNETKPDEAIVFADGEMTIYDIEKIKEYFLEQLGNYSNVLYDCSEVKKIDTSGIQLILASSKYAEAREKSFSIISPSNEVSDLFKLYGEL